ncbi:MAG: nuclear transport factor 2 family protein [Melioribacteraceae bacterium]
MKKYFLLIFLVPFAFMKSQTLSGEESAAILNVLEQQRVCWNNGDLAGYMKGYWKSDSTRFIGKSGINYGWNATFEAYKKGYPDKESMGALTFKVISIELLAENCVFMIGKWDLDRKVKAGGHFTLIWKKIGGQWLITTDHSS